MHIEFYTELDNLGELQDCETFAISNGSSNGLDGRVVLRDGTLMNAGSQLFRIDIEGFEPIPGVALDINQLAEASIFGAQGIAGTFVMQGLLSVSAAFSLFTDDFQFDIRGNSAGNLPGTLVYNGRTEFSFLFGLINYFKAMKLQIQQKT